MQTTINLTDLSGTFEAYKSCQASKNDIWESKHEDRINKLLEPLPSGSGIDSGTQFNWEDSTPQKLIFTLGFHHMNKNGYYDGWTEHKLIVTPNFGGYDLKITGRDRNQIKDYLCSLFDSIFVADTYTETYRQRARLMFKD